MCMCYKILNIFFFFVCFLGGEGFCSSEYDGEAFSLVGLPGKFCCSDLPKPLQIDCSPRLLFPCSQKEDSRQKVAGGLKTVSCSQDAITSIKEFASTYKNPLFLFDYDGLIANGTLYPRDPRLRFDSEGVWQPRCPALFDFFMNLRSEKPRFVYILSAGLLFSIEKDCYLSDRKWRPHVSNSFCYDLYSGAISSPFIKINDGLFFVEELGFHVKSLCGDGSDKGKMLGSVFDFLKERDVIFDAIAFIDDVESYAKGVHYAGDRLGVPTLSIYFPHP